jgi:dienelactone hydrolase
MGMKWPPAISFEEGRKLFDYDAKAPLEIQEAGTEKRGEVRIVDLSYASPKGGRVPAYLVLPPGEGRHPAVLFLHPGQGSRATFVDEAVELARDRGFVSLTISAPFLRPENKGARKGNPWNPEVSRAEQIQTIVDLRRGLDLLVSRPEVDPKRLAYVGHSLGATVGGTLAGIEKRPAAYVLMAGYPSLTHAMLHGHDQGALAFRELQSPESQKAYLDAMAPLDALDYIGHAAPAKLLFQFAKNDELITPWDAAAYLEAAPEPREVKWYDTDHYFDEGARRDRDEWLNYSLTLGSSFNHDSPGEGLRLVEGIPGDHVEDRPAGTERPDQHRVRRPLRRQDLAMIPQDRLDERAQHLDDLAPFSNMAAESLEEEHVSHLDGDARRALSGGLHFDEPPHGLASSRPIHPDCGIRGQ